MQVAEGDPPVTRVRFCRRTEQGWLHTAPDLEFWQDPILERHGDQLAFYYHQQDQPYIESLLAQLSQAFYEACDSVDCPAGQVFDVLLYPAHPESDVEPDLAIPSPWLSGIPVDGDWSQQIGENAVAAMRRAVVGWAIGEDAPRFSRRRSFVPEGGYLSL